MGRTLLGIFAGLVIGVTVTAGAGMVRGATGSDAGSSWVPDIEQVYNKALTNVFDAAGEKFTDPELKEFYDRLTGEITDSLSTPVPYDPGVDVGDLDPGISRINANSGEFDAKANGNTDTVAGFPDNARA